MHVPEKEMVLCFNEGMQSKCEDFTIIFKTLCNLLVISDLECNVAIELGTLYTLNKLECVLPLVYLSKYNYIIPIIQKVI